MSELTGRLESKATLSPAFAPVLDTLVNLSDAEFLAATDRYGIPADKQAARLIHHRQMTQRLASELQTRLTLSDEVGGWLFEEITGIPSSFLPKASKQEQALTFSQVQAGVRAGVLMDRSSFSSRSEETAELLAARIGWLRDWIPSEPTYLEILINKARGVKGLALSNEGGGLPPEELLVDFKRLLLEAIVKTTSYQDIAAIVHELQYPTAGGAKPHREMVIDHYLGKQERQYIIDAYGEDKRSDGLWFTYGSQEAIHLVCHSLITQEKATPDNPVEIAITDPTYPGFLMAVEEFLKAGTLKLRVVPIGKKGRVDIEALGKALKNPRCETVYFAEGNPMSIPISNLEEIAQLLNQREYDNIVAIEDRAYRNLGNEEKPDTADALMFHLPGKVIVLETLSKMGAPFRVGLVYTNWDAESTDILRNTMLHTQYNRSLGYSGLLSHTVNALLKYDQTTGAFTRHREKVRGYYQARRRLYLELFKEALNLAFGEGNYNMDEETIAQIGMFGWRKTSIPSKEYAEAAATLGLLLVPGSICTPEAEYLAVGEDNSQSPSHFHMRENYTWLPEANLRLGIIKDVMVEVVFSCLSPFAKKQTIERLNEEAKKINQNKPCPEIEVFISKVQTNNWIYPQNS